jgi:hypothetical protein
MRRIGFVLAGAAAMAIALAATSFGAPSSNAGPRDAVWGGGHFTWSDSGGEHPRDFSVNAELGRFGDADGTLVYGNIGATLARTNAVSCLAVSGKYAVIGGTDQLGGRYLFYMVDSGRPSSADSRDQVTPLLLLEPSDLAQMPAGFPSVCPSPTAVLNAIPYSDLTGGDIVVHDVG